MTDLYQKYETVKKNSKEFMKKGQISNYINSLVLMN